MKIIIDYFVDINITGDKFYKNSSGLYHRLNDLPAAIYADGTQAWCVDGKWHRDNDLPAVIWKDGTQAWWVDGKLHRINSRPAYIGADGNRAWYVNGVNITKQVLNWHKTNNIKYPPITPEEEQELAVLFELTFG